MWLNKNISSLTFFLSILDLSISFSSRVCNLLQVAYEAVLPFNGHWSFPNKRLVSCGVHFTEHSWNSPFYVECPLKAVIQGEYKVFPWLPFSFIDAILTLAVYATVT